MNRLVVTTFSDQGAVLHSQVWDPLQPLGMGYPFSFILEKVQAGVRVRDLKSLGAQTFSQSLMDSNEFLVCGRLRMKIHSASLSRKRVGWNPSYVESEEISVPGETERLKKLLGYSTLFLSLILGVSMLIPQPKVQKEELIPPQFAKLLLKPSPASASHSSQKDAASSNKVRASTVVQAFQSKQVQQSVHQLFKGGVLTLLKKSDLLSGTKSQAKLDTLFKEQSHLKNLVAGMNPMAGQTVQVAQFGGGSAAGAAGVGYGKGDHSVVSGQGKAYVSLETADSVVEEGLTKDEVGKVIHDHLSEVRYCYESAILRNPDAQGKLMIEFSIGGKGSASGFVKQAKVSSATLNDGSIGDCIVKKLTHWKFPNPRGGVDVAVNYPFIFKTLGKP